MSNEPIAQTLVEQLIEQEEGLDEYVDQLYEALPDELKEGPVRRLVGGGPVGHTLHPLLTDLPIGFWTSSWVLDLVPSAKTHRTSAWLIALGLASAVPTIVTGLSDWTALEEREDQRTGLVHAAANVGAFGLYTASLLARMRGHHKTGIAIGHVGAVAATVGGYLGGHLAVVKGAATEVSEQAMAQPS